MSNATRDSQGYFTWPLAVTSKDGIKTPQYLAGIVEYLPDLRGCFRYSAVSDKQNINPKVYFKTYI